MLSKELWSDKQPTRNYNWDTWIWNPRAWIVRRHFQGNVEVGLFFLFIACPPNQLTFGLYVGGYYTFK